jgi:D-sedoheptulose 7-phosphate isomerase
MNKHLAVRVSELTEVLENLEDACSETLEKVVDTIINAFENQKKILICGNGGSAADSQHFAAEFVSAFSRDIERRALPAMALTVDTSILTAYSNDFNFENVFQRQVEAYGNKGDVLIVLTTSGSSRNCIAAAKRSTELGLRTIAFTSAGGQISNFVENSLEIPSQNTQHIQECHIFLYHLIVELVENKMFRSKLK